MPFVKVPPKKRKKRRGRYIVGGGSKPLNMMPQQPTTSLMRVKPPAAAAREQQRESTNAASMTTTSSYSNINTAAMHRIMPSSWSPEQQQQPGTALPGQPPHMYRIRTLASQAQQQQLQQQRPSPVHPSAHPPQPHAPLYATLGLAPPPAQRHSPAVAAAVVQEQNEQQALNRIASAYYAMNQQRAAVNRVGELPVAQQQVQRRQQQRYYPRRLEHLRPMPTEHARAAAASPPTPQPSVISPPLPWTDQELMVQRIRQLDQQRQTVNVRPAPPASHVTQNIIQRQQPTMPLLPAKFQHHQLQQQPRQQGSRHNGLGLSSDFLYRESPSALTPSPIPVPPPRPFMHNVLHNRIRGPVTHAPMPMCDVSPAFPADAPQSITPLRDMAAALQSITPLRDVAAAPQRITPLRDMVRVPGVSAIAMGDAIQGSGAGREDGGSMQDLETAMPSHAEERPRAARNSQHGKQTMLLLPRSRQQEQEQQRRNEDHTDGYAAAHAEAGSKAAARTHTAAEETARKRKAEFAALLRKRQLELEKEDSSSCASEDDYRGTNMSSTLSNVSHARHGRLSNNDHVRENTWRDSSSQNERGGLDEVLIPPNDNTTSRSAIMGDSVSREESVLEDMKASLLLATRKRIRSVTSSPPPTDSATWTQEFSHSVAPFIVKVDAAQGCSDNSSGDDSDSSDTDESGQRTGGEKGNDDKAEACLVFRASEYIQAIRDEREGKFHRARQREESRKLLDEAEKLKVIIREKEEMVRLRKQMARSSSSAASVSARTEEKDTADDDFNRKGVAGNEKEKKEKEMWQCDSCMMVQCVSSSNVHCLACYRSRPLSCSAVVCQPPVHSELLSNRPDLSVVQMDVSADQNLQLLPTSGPHALQESAMAVANSLAVAEQIQQQFYERNHVDDALNALLFRQQQLGAELHFVNDQINEIMRGKERNHHAIHEDQSGDPVLALPSVGESDGDAADSSSLRLITSLPPVAPYDLRHDADAQRRVLLENVQAANLRKSRKKVLAHLAKRVRILENRKKQNVHRELLIRVSAAEAAAKEARRELELRLKERENIQKPASRRARMLEVSARFKSVLRSRISQLNDALYRAATRMRVRLKKQEMTLASAFERKKRRSDSSRKRARKRQRKSASTAGVTLKDIEMVIDDFTLLFRVTLTLTSFLDRSVGRWAPVVAQRQCADGSVMSSAVISEGVWKQSGQVERFDADSALISMKHAIRGPYKSPLMAFRAYRLSPNLLCDVSSITLSSCVDSSGALCQKALDKLALSDADATLAPRSTLGGCGSRSCGFVHIGDMTMDYSAVVDDCMEKYGKPCVEGRDSLDTNKSVAAVADIVSQSSFLARDCNEMPVMLGVVSRAVLIRQRKNVQVANFVEGVKQRNVGRVGEKRRNADSSLIDAAGRMKRTSKRQKVTVPFFSGAKGNAFPSEMPSYDVNSVSVAGGPAAATHETPMDGALKSVNGNPITEVGRSSDSKQLSLPPVDGESHGAQCCDEVDRKAELFSVAETSFFRSNRYYSPSSLSASLHGVGKSGAADTAAAEVEVDLFEARVAAASGDEELWVAYAEHVEMMTHSTSSKVTDVLFRGIQAIPHSEILWLRFCEVYSSFTDDRVLDVVDRALECVPLSLPLLSWRIRYAKAVTEADTFYFDALVRFQNAFHEQRSLSDLVDIVALSASVRLLLFSWSRFLFDAGHCTRSVDILSSVMRSSLKPLSFEKSFEEGEVSEDIGAVAADILTCADALLVWTGAIHGLVFSAAPLAPLSLEVVECRGSSLEAIPFVARSIVEGVSDNGGAYAAHFFITRRFHVALQKRCKLGKSSATLLETVHSCFNSAIAWFEEKWRLVSAQQNLQKDQQDELGEVADSTREGLLWLRALHFLMVFRYEVARFCSEEEVDVAVSRSTLMAVASLPEYRLHDHEFVTNLPEGEFLQCSALHFYKGAYNEYASGCTAGDAYGLLCQARHIADRFGFESAYEMLMKGIRSNAWWVTSASIVRDMPLTDLLAARDFFDVLWLNVSIFVASRKQGDGLERLAEVARECVDELCAFNRQAGFVGKRGAKVKSNMASRRRIALARRGLVTLDSSYGVCSAVVTLYASGLPTALQRRMVFSDACNALEYCLPLLGTWVVDELMEACRPVESRKSRHDEQWSARRLCVVRASNLLSDMFLIAPMWYRISLARFVCAQSQGIDDALAVLHEALPIQPMSQALVWRLCVALSQGRDGGKRQDPVVRRILLSAMRAGMQIL